MSEAPKASEAKKIAQERIRSDEARKVAESAKTKVAESDRLFNHFMQHITRAANLGKFALDKQTFPESHFTQSTVDEVVSRLKEQGYNVQIDRHNALQTRSFIITW